MKRNDWTFDYTAARLAEAAQAKIAQATNAPRSHRDSPRNDAPFRLRRPATRTFVPSVTRTWVISPMI